MVAMVPQWSLWKYWIHLVLPVTKKQDKCGSIGAIPQKNTDHSRLYPYLSVKSVAVFINRYKSALWHSHLESGVIRPRYEPGKKVS
jgi:hypothetical protein